MLYLEVSPEHEAGAKIVEGFLTCGAGKEEWEALLNDEMSEQVVSTIKDFCDRQNVDYEKTMGFARTGAKNLLKIMHYA